MQHDAAPDIFAVRLAEQALTYAGIPQQRAAWMNDQETWIDDGTRLAIVITRVGKDPHVRELRTSAIKSIQTCRRRIRGKGDLQQQRQTEPHCETQGNARHEMLQNFRRDEHRSLR